MIIVSITLFLKLKTLCNIPWTNSIIHRSIYLSKFHPTLPRSLMASFPPFYLSKSCEVRGPRQPRFSSSSAVPLRRCPIHCRVKIEAVRSFSAFRDLAGPRREPTGFRSLCNSSNNNNNVPVSLALSANPFVFSLNVELHVLYDFSTVSSEEIFDSLLKIKVNTLRVYRDTKSIIDIMITLFQNTSNSSNSCIVP